MEAAKDDCVVLAIKLGEGVMRAGGETYRAEECCERVLSACGASEISVVAFPTAILISADVDGAHRTEIVSIKHRSVDLKKIEEYNGISRMVAEGKMGVDKALAAIRSSDKERPFLSIAFTALAAGFFAFVFNGGVWDFLPTCLITFIATAFKHLADRLLTLNFLSTMGSSMIVTALARFTVAAFPVCSQEAMIVGGIISMLPGLALTNSLRDTISGDFISGVARMFEALVTAIVLAAGVAIVLSF